MTLFLANFLAFPVAIFSGLLMIVVLYWLIAAFGLLNIDVLNIDSPTISEIGGAEAMNFGTTDGEVPVGGLSGLLLRLGLSGVPITLIITIITLIGWFITYFSQHLLLRFIDWDLVRYTLACLVLLFSLFIAVILTAIIIRPLRPLFQKINLTTSAKSLSGKTVEIRSSYVSLTRGEANYEDGGAGMILEVRADESAEFKRGDRAVIISYSPESHTYNIVSEDQFNDL